MLGAILMQGFQCASPEFTTAKLAMKNREYEKAEEYFNKEVQKNPQNAEAWALLAESRMFLKRYQESNEAANQALNNSKNDQKILIQIMQLKNKLWIDTYSSAIDNINKYYKTKDDKAINQALNDINTAIMINPMIFEFNYIKGTILETMNDQESAVKEYEKYYKLILPSLDFAKSKGFFVNSSREDIIAKLGKPQSSTTATDGAGNPTMTDVFMVDGKEFYLKTVADDNGKLVAQAWRYNPPALMSPFDKQYIFSLYIEPLATLVQYNFDNKNYEQALTYLNGILILEPYNEAANNFVVTVYDALGKKEEATKRIEALIKNDPDNKSFRLSYGNLLMQLERYDDAITQYLKALELDSEFIDAIRNIASAYKNKAFQIQMQQKAEFDKNPKYKINKDEFMPYIVKSGEYFSKCRENPRFTYDIDVLFDLVDIYFVTNDTPNLKKIVAELEKIEDMVPEDRQIFYYGQMVKLFDQKIVDNEKAKKYMEKFEKLSQ